MYYIRGGGEGGLLYLFLFLFPVERSINGRVISHVWAGTHGPRRGAW